MQIKDRIKELRRVRASDLIPNPKNWRIHPAAQQEGLRTMLSKVGYTDAVIARETPDGLMLVDGHLRAETTPDAEVPVLVTDLSEAEADEVLATLDPLASLAETDVSALKGLLDGIDNTNEELNTLLKDISDTYNVGLAELREQATKADYVPPDGHLTGPGRGNVPDDVKGILIHFELDKYDEVMEMGYTLGEAWGIGTLSNVLYKALRQAADGLPEAVEPREVVASGAS
jgi:hypothetical protein